MLGSLLSGELESIPGSKGITCDLRLAESRARDGGAEVGVWKSGVAGLASCSVLSWT